MASTPAGTGEGVHDAHHRASQFTRQLLHPSGRRIHIAPNPEEHGRLKLRLTTSEPDEEFDVYVHGSDEHLAAVREIHAYAEQQRVQLRERHAEIYEDFERVHHQLDLLSSELQRLTDHGVSLDANFSKYGYDAHLRTKEPDSSANSTYGHFSEHEPRDWAAERHKGVALTLWKKPVVRQYFHRGLLWRSSMVEEVASFELFVDLLYVGIIAIVGDAAAENATRSGFLQFVITFTLGWKMWNDLTMFISWFETDDICQRVGVLFVMVCLFGYTLNIVNAFDTTWTQLVSFYLAQRLFSGLYLLFVAYVIPMVRGAMFLFAILGLIPSVLWIFSIHLDYPNRLILVWIAIALDLFGPLSMILMRRLPGRRLKAKAASWFDFYPALNIEHKTERTNAFVTLVLGYSVVSLLYQNKGTAFALDAFFGKATLGLIQAFSFNWIYFEVDGFNLHTHAIRRSALSSVVWTTFHLPFIMAYTLAGASLSRLVLAYDCANTDPENLDDGYVSRSESEISMGLRWFYCAGLGAALISMTLISFAHVHKKVDRQRIMKRPRLVVRLTAAVILICLPLADDLNSLQLISTTTGLIVLVLMIEVWGQTPKADCFWQDRRKCQYSAECRVRKKLIDDALKTGVTIDVAELTKNDGENPEKGLFEVV